MQLTSNTVEEKWGDNLELPSALPVQDDNLMSAQNDDLNLVLAPTVPMLTSKWLMKVLSGVHFGAEVTIEKGVTRVGSAEDNDIILSDTNVLPYYFEIHFTDEFIEIDTECSQAQIFSDNLLVRGLVKKFQALDYLAVGDLHFVCGPTSADWPAVHAAKTLLPDSAGVVVKPDSKDEFRRIIAMLNIRPTSLAQFVIALTLIGSIFTVSVSYLSRTQLVEPIAEAQNENPTPKTSRLDLGGMSAINVLENEKGVVEVTGYVRDSQQYSALRIAVSALRQPFTFEVHIEEQLLQNLRYLLKKLNYPDLKIEYGDEAGVFVMRGYLQDPNQWQAIKDQLFTDVFGLTDIVPAYETIETRAQWLQQRLASADLGNLSLHIKAGVITITGEIAVGGLANWRQVEGDFRQRYGGKPTIKFSQVKGGKRNFDISGVSLGPNPYLITKTGKRVTVGGHMKGGYLVDSISHDKIVFSKSGKATIYQLGSKDDE